MKKKRAYGYIRTALAESSYVQLQAIRIKEHCTENSMRLVDFFIDNGKSGLRTFQNNGFDEMLSRCSKKDKVDAIVVTDPERISRDRTDYVLFLALLKRKGIDLIVLNNSYKCTPEEEFSKTMVEAVQALFPASHRQK